MHYLVYIRYLWSILYIIMYNVRLHSSVHALMHGIDEIIYARILKAHSHSMSGGWIRASLECQCCFGIAGGWAVT
jgi:hypothetical protein